MGASGSELESFLVVVVVVDEVSRARRGEVGLVLVCGSSVRHENPARATR